MEAKWTKADENVNDLFNKWGNHPYNAILTTTLFGIDCEGTNKARYDLTILKHDNGSYIPAHGGVLMPACKTLRNAKINALNWFNREQQFQVKHYHANHS